MASKTAVLKVNIVSDAKDGVRGLDQTGDALDRMGTKLDKVTPAAGLAAAGVLAFVKVTGDAASELEQSTGAVESVFKSYADTVVAQSNRAAEAVGLSKKDYRSMAAVVGSQLKNMGVNQDAIAGKTDDLIELGADLAAQFGGPTSDAVNALSSLLRGERDPIERYGVSIKEADIQAQKAAMGLAGLTGEADKAATTQATLALLMAQTADAQGTFARETDTAAGSQAIANAKWQDASAALGTAFLPFLTDAANTAADLAGYIADNSEEITPWIVALGLAAGAILAVKVAVEAAQAAQILWNIAVEANPWVLLATVILVAVGALVYATVETEKYVKWYDNAEQAVRDFAAQLDKGFNVTWISDLVGWLLDLNRALRDAIGFWIDFNAAASKGKAGRGSVRGPGSGGDFGFARMAAMGDDSFMPMGFSAMADAPALESPAYVASSTGRAGGFVPQSAVNVNLTVNGAIDRDGTARTIVSVLNDYFRSSGQLTAAGLSWQG